MTQPRAVTLDGAKLQDELGNPAGISFNKKAKTPLSSHLVVAVESLATPFHGPPPS